MKHIKSETALCSFRKFPFKSYRMLTFVYDDDDDNSAADSKTDDDDMFIAIAQTLLC